MKLDEIKSVKITSVEKEINEYLNKGYVITKIFSTKISTDQVEQVQPTFILGCSTKSK